MPGEFGFLVRNVFAQPSGHRILGLAGLVDGLRVRVALLKTQYVRGGVSRGRPFFVPGGGVPSREPGETYTFGQLKLNIGCIAKFGRIPDGGRTKICVLRVKTNWNDGTPGWGRGVVGQDGVVTRPRETVFGRITHLVTSPFAFSLFRHFLSRRNGDSCTTAGRRHTAVSRRAVSSCHPPHRRIRGNAAKQNRLTPNRRAKRNETTGAENDDDNWNDNRHFRQRNNTKSRWLTEFVVLLVRHRHRRRRPRRDPVPARERPETLPPPPPPPTLPPSGTKAFPS